MASVGTACTLFGLKLLTYVYSESTGEIWIAVGCSPTRNAVTPGTVRLVSKIAPFVKLTTATVPLSTCVTAPRNCALTSGSDSSLFSHDASGST